MDPRLSGGGPRTPHALTWVYGGSPPKRGRATHHQVVVIGIRWIPAYAGEGRSLLTRRLMYPVDPRLRGGGPASRLLVRGPRGGSPLTRGRGKRARWDSGSVWWIPAYAGEGLHHYGAVAFYDVILESRVHGYDLKAPHWCR